MSDSIDTLKKQLEELKKSVCSLQQKNSLDNSTIIAIFASSYEHSAIGTMTVKIPGSKESIDATHSLFISKLDDPDLVSERVLKSLLNALSTALTTLETIQPEGLDIQIFTSKTVLIRAISDNKGLLLLEPFHKELIELSLNKELIDYINILHASLLRLQNTVRKTIYIRDLYEIENIITKTLRNQLYSQINNTVYKIRKAKKNVSSNG